MSAPDRNAAALRLSVCLESLMSLILKETQLLKAGRLREGLQTQAAKEDAARAYLDALRALSGPHLPQGTLKADLIKQSQAFESLLSENLAVLSTVRSVSESILRDLSQKLAGRQPAAYGPARRESAPAPLALSRST